MSTHPRSCVLQHARYLGLQLTARKDAGVAREAHRTVAPPSVGLDREAHALLPSECYLVTGIASRCMRLHGRAWQGREGRFPQFGFLS